MSIRERQRFKDQFNESVRENNKLHSRSESLRNTKSAPKESKKDIRDNYWQKIKGLVDLELQKEKFEKSIEFP